MDRIDKGILSQLLRDGRTTQRQMAENLGISAQALNYRLNRLMSEGVVRGFKLHVTPKFYGEGEFFAAFNGDISPDGKVTKYFRCLEKATVIGFRVRDASEMQDTLRRYSERYGQPIMRYVPPSGQPYMPNSIDRQVVEYLRNDPRVPTAKVSEDLGIPYNTVKRRLNTLFSRHLIEVVPLIDLSKTDGVLFSIFTENMPQISGAFNEGLVFAINDERSGILVFFVENLPTAKGIIERARRIDPGAETMVIFDYQFF